MSIQYLLIIARSYKAFTLQDLIKCQSQTCAIYKDPPGLCVAELRNISNSNNERKKEKVCERNFICPRKKIEIGRDEARSRKVIKCLEILFVFLRTNKRKNGKRFFFSFFVAFSFTRTRFCLFSQPQERKH